MKLFIQIPCLNEEKTLPLVLNSIPKTIDGVSKIEVLVIDDGSTDKTVKVAKKMGVKHFVHHMHNKGLARSFADGINYSLKNGADIIVNTDADNQYPQKDIGKLIAPIIKGDAEIVIGDRQTDKIKHFSPLKKILQKLGSKMVRTLSGSSVPDAVSGFRAYSRNAAIQLNIVTEFSYVIETIIQAQSKRIAIASVKVNTNPPTRKSRLFKNMFQHIRQSTATMIRIYTMYRPLMVFVFIGMIVSFIGMLIGFRFLFYFLLGQGGGHIQSLIFAAIFITVGFQISMTGMVADLTGINRRLIENMLQRVKHMELRQRRVQKDGTKVLEQVKRIKTNGQISKVSVN